MFCCGWAPVSYTHLELKGYFDPANDVLGKIEKNTAFGIYGDADQEITNGLYTDPIPAASREEVHLGEASILCTLSDDGVQEYTCEIVKVNKQDAPDGKSFVVQIDDQDLLAQTGGIVQGMSGSPVIQDGKLIGADVYKRQGSPGLPLPGRMVISNFWRGSSLGRTQLPSISRVLLKIPI